MRQVIDLLTEQGLRVAAIKQARDDFDVDRPDKDSYKLRKAGVEQLILGSEQQSAHVIEHAEDNKTDGTESQLNYLLAYLDWPNLDIVLVEGFNDTSPYAKIALHRQTREQDSKIDRVNDSSLIAIATDDPYLVASVPLLDINDPALVAGFIHKYSLTIG